MRDVFMKEKYPCRNFGVKEGEGICLKGAYFWKLACTQDAPMQKMQSMQLYTSNDLHSVKLPKIWPLASTVSKIFLFCDLFFAKVFIHEIVYKNVNGMDDAVFTHSISTTNWVAFKIQAPAFWPCDTAVSTL